MAQFFAIHSDNPQVRLIQKAADVVRQGGVVVLPTDSGYALGCALENKRGVDVIRQIRRLDDKHNFTLLCRDLSEIAMYARVENQEYRLLKAHTPEPIPLSLRRRVKFPDGYCIPSENKLVFGFQIIGSRSICSRMSANP